MESAGNPHTFLGIDQEGHTAIVHTTGNPDRHIILRGGRTPNYDAESIRACGALLTNAGLPRGILVDCSHGQTHKDFRRQPEVLADLMRQIVGGNRSIMGFMLESNLKAGNQKVVSGRAGLEYGVSITDACIDWETTERCLTEAATALQDEAATVRAGIPA
jgi:3-deoxy-7-phosphoheptulonate synthase